MRHFGHIAVLLILSVLATSAAADLVLEIVDAPQQWWPVTRSFKGPKVSEKSTASPFTDYRLTVKFTHTKSGRSFVVPGYFAADGKAAETGAEAGSVWRAHLTPDVPGEWQFAADLRTGPTWPSAMTRTPVSASTSPAPRGPSASAPAKVGCSRMSWKSVTDGS